MFWGPKHLLSNAVLRAIGRDSVVGWRVFLDAFFKATCAHLEKLSREVVDERSALAAVDFSRYLQNSGAVELLTRYRDASQDFSRVRTLISDLAEQAGPWLRGSRVPAKAPSVELGEVHEKLEAILAAVARPALFPQPTQLPIIIGNTGSGGTNQPKPVLSPASNLNGNCRVR